MRGPWTVCLYRWPTWQRPFTENYRRYWKNLSKRIGRRIHFSVWEVMLMLFEDIPDKSHAARSNRRGSLWNWGRWMLGMYWNSATLVSGMGGRRLSCSSSGCHGRDGCWEAMRITVVLWESLIFWRVLGTMGAGGKAYTRPKLSQDMERASTAQALSSG